MCDLDADVRQAVFERVQTCLSEVVGSRGHLTGYGIERNSFDVTESDDLGGGLTRFVFTADGNRMSEFSREPIDVGELSGSIVLDEEFNLTFDSRGQVQFTPHRIVHPRFWERQPGWATATEWDSPDTDLYSSEIPELIAGAYNPIRWRPGTQESVVDAVQGMLDTRGETVVLIDEEADIADITEFATAMEAVSQTLSTDHDLEVVQEHLEVPRAMFRRASEDAD